MGVRVRVLPTPAGEQTGRLLGLEALGASGAAADEGAAGWHGHKTPLQDPEVGFRAEQGRAWASFFPFAANPPGGTGRGAPGRERCRRPRAGFSDAHLRPPSRPVLGFRFTLGASQWTGESLIFGLICLPRGITRSLSMPNKLQNSLKQSFAL